MSTKTTFKRIALVAVATLGLGMISAAPSSAAGLASDVVTLGTPSATATIDAAATSSVTLTGYCVAAGDLGVYAIYIKSVPTSGTGTVGPLLMTASSSAPVGNVTIAPAGGTATDAVEINCTGAGFYTAKATVSATVPSAGTYVFAVAGVYQAGSTKDWTVTAAARPAVSATHSTSVATALTGAYGDDTTGISAPKALGAAADIAIELKNAATSTTTLADVSALTAVVSGPGLVSWDTDTSVGRSITATTKSLTPVLHVYSDGNAGTAEITISMGTTKISTEKVVFYGSVATLTASAVRSVVPVAAGTGYNNDPSSGYGAFKVTAVDSLGLAVPNANIYLVSSAATVANYANTLCGVTSLTGSLTCDVYGATAGTFTLTATTKATATATTGVDSNAVAYRVSAGKIAKISTTFNGQKDTTIDQKQAFKFRLTLEDANGPVTQGCYYVAEDPLDGTTWFETSATGQIWFGYSGQVCVNHQGFYEYTDTAYWVGVGTGVIQTAKKPLAGVTYNLSNLTVVNDSGDAASDAAAEATDAANAATDAANAAAEAADAATAAAQDAADAIAALATQVNEQIAELKAQNDALRKQLIALTNLIIKIQKKVKA